MNNNSITVLVDKKYFDKIKYFYEDNIKEKTPPYALFQAEVNNTVITLYTSGKCLFQGKLASEEANIWTSYEENKILEKKEKKEEVKEVMMIYDKYNNIGSDEVGTGDYFGPIVVTACYITKEQVSYLNKYHITDSKKITDEKIKELAKVLIKEIKYKTIILNNLDYNKYSEYNMNKMKAILHNKVLCMLEEEVKPNIDYIIIDQFTTPKSYYSYLINTKKPIKELTFITKAESKSMAVAAASIISRYIFLGEMEKLNKMMNMILPLGASNLVDEAGKKIVTLYGKDKLKEIAKYNFKTTDKILNGIDEN